MADVVFLPKNPDGSVGYINTNKDDPSFGVPVYQDGYGNLIWTQPGAPGRSPSDVSYGKLRGSTPAFISATPPSPEAAPITGATAQDVANQEATVAQATTGPKAPPSTTTPTASPPQPAAAPNQPVQPPAAPTPTPVAPQPAPAPVPQNQPQTPPPTQAPAPGQPAPAQPAPQPASTLTPEQQAAQAANKAKLDQLLANPSLTPDQKAAINAIYNAVSANDQSQADQIKAAIAAATQYSDPYFKAQTRMVLDSLDRGFQAIDGDLSYKETSLQNALQDLQRDIAASKDYLTFSQLQEMKALERNYTQQIDTTQQDMAARGFTSSSIRSKKEQLIGETYGDLRESSNRAFLAKEQAYNNQLGDAQQNTALEVQRLQQLAAQGKLDATRQAEQQVGSAALQGTPYQSNTLGGIGGEIPAAQIRDANSFASQFVF